MSHQQPTACRKCGRSPMGRMRKTDDGGIMLRLRCTTCNLSTEEFPISATSEPNASWNSRFGRPPITPAPTPQPATPDRQSVLHEVERVASRAGISLSELAELLVQQSADKDAGVAARPALGPYIMKGGQPDDIITDIVASDHRLEKPRPGARSKRYPVDRLCVGDVLVTEPMDARSLRNRQAACSSFGMRNGLVFDTEVIDGRLFIRRMPNDYVHVAPNNKHNFHLMGVGDIRELPGDNAQSLRKVAQVYALRKGWTLRTRTNRATRVITLERIA